MHFSIFFINPLFFPLKPIGIYKYAIRTLRFSFLHLPLSLASPPLSPYSAGIAPWATETLTLSTFSSSTRFLSRIASAPASPHSSSDRLLRWLWSELRALHAAPLSSGALVRRIYTHYRVLTGFCWSLWFWRCEFGDEV